MRHDAVPAHRMKKRKDQGSRCLSISGSEYGIVLNSSTTDFTEKNLVHLLREFGEICFFCSLSSSSSLWSFTASPSGRPVADFVLNPSWGIL